ncbi:MAG TPA: hypothetical protein VFO16_15880 [Pseudonocardiaceae bacterium]|nr:hypothetical protein [Pseudonocardiaceae bacterium]
MAVIRNGSMPEALASSGQAWFDALCATDSRAITPEEAALVPPGAPLRPCAVP